MNEKDKLVFTVPVFGDLEKMKIGQKIIIMGNSISSSIFEECISIHQDQPLERLCWTLTEMPWA